MQEPRGYRSYPKNARVWSREENFSKNVESVERLANLYQDHGKSRSAKEIILAMFIAYLNSDTQKKVDK